jgi:hypothetical protein
MARGGAARNHSIAARYDSIRYHERMADVRTELVKAKRKLESDLQILLESFEADTGLSVHEVKLSRGNVAGNSSPALSRVETTVHLISG